METDFYKLFNLSLAKQKGTLTDEMVKENYLNKRKQYFQMIKKCADNKEQHSIPELKELLDDDYLKLLDEAYEAIKTESDRKKYDELIANSEKESKNQSSNEQQNSNNNSVNTEISFIPIYKGNFGKLPPKNNMHSTKKSESKEEHNSTKEYKDNLEI